MMDGVMNLCRVKFRDHQRLTRQSLSEYSVPTYQDMGEVPRAGNDSGGGQLGNGSTGGITTPVEVDGITNALDVAAAREHTCALLKDKSVACWGEGYLGDGPASSSASPVPVHGL